MRNEFIGQVLVPLRNLLDINSITSSKASSDGRLHGGKQKFINQWYPLEGRDGKAVGGTILLTFRLELPIGDGINKQRTNTT